MLNFFMSLLFNVYVYLYYHGKYIVLVLGFLVALWVIGRVGLIFRVAKTENCPQCHGTKFMRIHRLWFERILGYGMKARRYRCENPDCEWEGMRRHTKRGDL